MRCSQNIKNKTGQVTIFIILGLILLLTTGLVLYFATEAFKYPGLSDEMIPIAKYTEQCVEDVALKGIFQAGLQGGVIYPAYEEDKAYLDVGFNIPYWFLAGEDRSVTILRLETELENYLNANLNSCLNNFASFEDQFAFTQVADQNLSTLVDVAAEDVSIDAAIPMQISDGTTVTTLPTIKISFENSIGNKLFLAYQIMKTENEEGFLEFYTDEMIAASAWLPYEGFDFTCKPKRWKVDEMKDYIQQLVAVNLPFLRFEGTSYEPVGDPYYDSIYLVDVGAGRTKDLAVKTSYNPDWGMDLDVQPNKNGVVTDIKMVGQTIAIPCVKVYHHKYSADFPVLFTITDKDNSDYPFFFAVPVLMRRNEPDRYAEMQQWPSETDQVRSAEYCSKTALATTYTVGEDGTLIAEQAEQDTWLYSLDVIAMDSLYGFDQILDDVTIRYKCGQFTCEIGTTEYGSGNVLVTYPLLSTTFPSCINGQIIVEKEDYQSTKVFQTVSEATDGATINIEMHRLQPLDFDVTVVVNHNNVLSERNVEEDELVVITVTNSEQNFEKMMVYPIEDEETGKGVVGFDTLELLVASDMTYLLDIKLIENDIYTGGFVYNWTPDVNAISAATKTQFYVIKKDILLATDENYREAMQYAEEESKNYQPELS